MGSLAVKVGIVQFQSFVDSGVGNALQEKEAVLQLLEVLAFKLVF